MKLLYILNKYLLLASFLAMPAAFLFQGYRSQQFAAAQAAQGVEPMNCSFIGILYAFLFFIFIYLIPFIIWNFALRNRLRKHWSVTLQLLIIFVIATLPGVFIATLGFMAK